ncbi:MAG: ShlB/FhaC/HecB family hemolysin secretion/activation protein [Rickettsiales bacterium]|jgi:hemolysin activation/secretion protein|nr:ShlB/FhaC/HecB family hemolysin secretion/activation protein [Rickettsiales bacterium]
MFKIITTIIIFLITIPISLHADEALEIKNMQDYIEHNKRRKEIQAIKQRPAELEYKAEDISINNESCLEIKQVIISGSTIFADELLQEIANQYISDCTNLGSIQKIIHNINSLYFEDGYITSRAALPTPQTRLGEYILTLNIMEGKIDKVILSERLLASDDWSENQNSLKARMAMPNFPNQIFNIRIIEQAVDNFASITSNHTSYEIMPHSELEGFSNIIIKNIISSPYNINLSLNNAGSKETGEDKYSLNASLDNPLNLNDNLTLYYGSSYGEDADYKSSISESLNYSIPLGNYDFSYLLSRSSYRLGTDLTQSTFYSFGSTIINNFAINRNMGRNQFYKGNLELSLSLKNIKSYNEVLDVKIANDSGTRKLSIAKISYLSTIYSKFGTFLIKPGYVFGLKSFDALDDNNSDFSEEAQYEALTLYMHYNTSFTTLPLRYNITFDSQLSNDSLFSSESFVAGGDYSVRGFKYEYLQGDSGLSIRNNLGLLPQLFQTRFSKINSIYPEIFFDYGMVKTNGISSHDYVSGTGITLHYSTKKTKSHITYSKSLHTPASLEKESQAVYMSISYSFN